MNWQERDAQTRAVFNRIFPGSECSSDEYKDRKQKELDDYIIKHTKLAIDRAERLKAAIAQYKTKQHPEFMDYKE